MIFVDLCFVITSACSNEEQGLLMKELFQAPFFKIVIVYDRETVEMCGALKVSNELRHEKTNILVSDLVRHKPGCTATEDC